MLCVASRSDTVMICVLVLRADLSARPMPSLFRVRLVVYSRTQVLTKPQRPTNAKMDIARGMSLRKKRSVKPKISAPKQISGPIQTQQRPSLPTVSEAAGATTRPRLPGPSSSNSSLNIPRARAQGNASTADYVKRRYSTRINLENDFGDAPAMPTLPTEFLSQPPAKAPGRLASSAGEKIAVDLKALQDPSLPAEQCMSLDMGVTSR